MKPSLKLTISAEHLEQVVDQARQQEPYEICGLMGGRNGQVESIVPIPNASRSPQTSFEMERQAMVDAIIQFQRAGQEVVAIYHSHPQNAAIPSESDIAQATWPDAVYLIVGLSDPDQPDIRAWSIQKGRVQPAELIVDGVL
jgi:proteasome lid subunit RPN8/RPN11